MNHIQFHVPKFKKGTWRKNTGILSHLGTYCYLLH